MVSMYPIRFAPSDIIYYGEFVSKATTCRACHYNDLVKHLFHLSDTLYGECVWPRVWQQVTFSQVVFIISIGPCRKYKSIELHNWYVKQSLMFHNDMEVYIMASSELPTYVAS